jgi:hypothetical protein
MEDKTALMILKNEGWLEKDKLRNLTPYIYVRSKNKVQLDGDFTPNELRAIAWWVENK